MNKKSKEECLCCKMQNNKRKVFENELTFAMYDEFPVTKFHMLIIPKRHFDNFFDISNSELLDLYTLIKYCKENICEKDKNVCGFNVGVNVGLVSGQSIPHVHVHLIPRRFGDIDDPRGGVRGVIPDKRIY